MSRLSEAIEEFQGADAETRLYLLLDYGERLPPLPPRLEAARDAGLGRVNECQAPVFLYPEVEEADGERRLRFHADVPETAPTVRGFVGLLAATLDGAPAADVANLPDDLLHQLGIAQQLGMMRQQGLAGVIYRVKHAVAEVA